MIEGEKWGEQIRSLDAGAKGRAVIDSKKSLAKRRKGLDGLEGDG